jgi:hypothetical protein
MWSAARCPVRDSERDWIEQSLHWMVEEFGQPVLRRPVVLPTSEYFPGSYAGSVDDVRRVLAIVCRHMEVDVERIDFDFIDDDEHDLVANVPVAVSSRNAAGHFEVRAGRPVVAVASSVARDPVALVATIAHELGHVRLLGEDRIPVDRQDHEPLTDLLSVFFGLGVFAANAAFRFSTSRAAWQARRLGYLTEPMFGYGLAYYSYLRGEWCPGWRRYLDTNPRVYLRRGLRYLRRCQGAAVPDGQRG